MKRWKSLVVLMIGIFLLGCSDGKPPKVTVGDDGIIRIDRIGPGESVTIPLTMPIPQKKESEPGSYERVSEVLLDMVLSSNAKVEFLLEITDIVDKGRVIRQPLSDLLGGTVFYIDEGLYEKYKELGEKHLWMGGLGLADLWIRPMSDYKEGEKI